jgi:hypothetical protein
MHRHHMTTNLPSLPYTASSFVCAAITLTLFRHLSQQHTTTGLLLMNSFAWQDMQDDGLGGGGAKKAKCFCFSSIFIMMVVGCANTFICLLSIESTDSSLMFVLNAATSDSACSESHAPHARRCDANLTINMQPLHTVVMTFTHRSASPGACSFSPFPTLTPTTTTLFTPVSAYSQATFSS